MDEKPVSNNERKPKRRGRLSARFRRMNVLIFVAAFFIMTAVMMWLLSGFVEHASSEFADQYAYSTAEALSAHISRELKLVSRAAQSENVIAWMTDEFNEDKKARAFDDVVNIVGDLYSFNLYIGIDSTHNEYVVDTGYALMGIELVNVLNESEPDDEWYYKCIESGTDYMLNIGIDRYMQRKRVWLNYCVTRDGVPLGVICTGLEFSHVAGELFSHYDSSIMRGLIIDNNGVIVMDSSLMSDMDFLHNDFEARIEDEFSDPELLTAVESHMNSIGDYPETLALPIVARLRSGPFRYVAITPIRLTNWSILILSGDSTLFDISYFIPMLLTVLALLLMVALITSAANFRLIFRPLSKIGQSLIELRENHEGRIYGVDRDDELGELSKTIEDLFTKANRDGLTGIYNRRFMESNLENIMGMLSRSNGLLSVLMLDIDFFKKFNDAYGHDRGDACLRAVAGALEGTTPRSSDFVARYGGEEFIVILTNTGEGGARVVAEKLLDNVRALDIPHSGSSVAPYVTVSIGVTANAVTFRHKWEDYVKRADEALYMSKQNGRNRYTYLAMPSD